jgi:hypothetical protein
MARDVDQFDYFVSNARGGVTVSALFGRADRAYTGTPVTRTGDKSKAVTVHYASANGSATAGSDYTAISSTIRTQTSTRRGSSPSRLG